ncbi:sigma-70 family RNA polymerase sigma factor [Corticibacter populi]|uniref:Sigma-70 family RNA polymerase sigma factor n=1 Tax=Corticibacter populi TaxID=1550736 RepID=A0A3M6QKK0_9BURK|nr:sigma-70 family RNA polymerase sigma factor [Corticibacter populi]RMX03455.1 sigma-70 family RNA polymerase sigma factor [Corticibacter populi]RZS29893.1 RNA polymerase sigma-70 factor (ECF subfamily) [Corticibacter populi]
MAQDPHIVFLGHRQELLAWLMRHLREREQAEDVVQELYLRYVQYASTHVIEDSRAYLFQMARNMLIDLRRQQQARPTESLGHDELVLVSAPDTAPGPEQIAAARSRLRQLVACLEQLPELTQQIFLLNRVHDMSYKEVADQLGVSVSTVQKHLTRALAHVTERMKPH